MEQEPIRIGLVFGYGLDYYRDIMRGIRSYAAACPRWVFTPIAPEPEAVRSLRPLELDGLIAQVIDLALAGALLDCGKPLVNVSGVLPELPVARVGVDHVAVGRMAAEHLLGCGLREFAFVGYAGLAFSEGREAGFRRELAKAGFSLSVYHQQQAIRWEASGLWRWDEELPRFLQGLPRPAGVFASHDLQGVQLSEACRRSGLHVPEEIALVGVDNDDLLCELARPSLSSVALPAERIGFEAARVLDRLITRPGRPAPRRPLLLPPAGVVARGSSDVLAIGDEVVAAALRFIRQHSHEPIQVADVLAEVQVSRRSLERRFQHLTGHTLWEKIRQCRIDRARSLLAGTELPMSAVARSAGFGESKQLSVVFRQVTGMTPSEYRRRTRAR